MDANTNDEPWFGAPKWFQKMLINLQYV